MSHEDVILIVQAIHAVAGAVYWVAVVLIAGIIIGAITRTKP